MAAVEKESSASIVIVGSWNPAILQPPWIVRHGFEADAANTPVQLEMSMLAGQPPRFRMLDFLFVPNFDKLTVTAPATDAETLGRWEQVVRRILLALPHTPVSGMGMNFAYEDAEPSAELLALFADPEQLAERTGLEYENQSTTVTRAMAIGPLVLNFTRMLGAGPLITYRFNFHYSITEATAAAALLVGRAAENLAVVQQVLTAYYPPEEGQNA